MRCKSFGPSFFPLLCLCFEMLDPGAYQQLLDNYNPEVNGACCSDSGLQNWPAGGGWGLQGGARAARTGLAGGGEPLMGKGAGLCSNTAWGGADCTLSSSSSSAKTFYSYSPLARPQRLVACETVIDQ